LAENYLWNIAPKTIPVEMRQWNGPVKQASETGQWNRPVEQAGGTVPVVH